MRKQKPKHTWSEWGNKMDRYKKTGSTVKNPKAKALEVAKVGQGQSKITGNIYNL